MDWAVKTVCSTVCLEEWTMIFLFVFFPFPNPLLYYNIYFFFVRFHHRQVNFGVSGVQILRMDWTEQDTFFLCRTIALVDRSVYYYTYNFSVHRFYFWVYRNRDGKINKYQNMCGYRLRKSKLKWKIVLLILSKLAYMMKFEGLKSNFDRKIRQ